MKSLRSTQFENKSVFKGQRWLAAVHMTLYSLQATDMSFLHHKQVSFATMFSL